MKDSLNEHQQRSLMIMSKNPIINLEYSRKGSPMTTKALILLGWMLGFVLIGCEKQDKVASADQAAQEKVAEPPKAPANAWESATIIGSAETPDPVLERVKMLEAQKMVKEVVVMESFPVKIQLKAPQYVIDDLNKIPRKKP